MASIQLPASIISARVTAANKTANCACDKLREFMPDSITGIVRAYLRYSEQLASVLNSGLTITMDKLWGVRGHRVYIKIAPQLDDYMEESDLDPEPNPHFEIYIGVEEMHGTDSRVLATHYVHADDVWQWLQGVNAIDVASLSVYDSKFAQEACPKEIPPLNTFAANMLRMLHRDLLQCK